MKRLTYILAIIAVAYLLQSCDPAMNVRHSNKRSGIIRVKQFTDKKTTLMWAHHDPTQRQTLMYVDDQGNIRVLAEQSPDAAITSNIELDPKVKIEGKIDAELLLKTQATLSKLTSRSTSLMIVREALYRLSEAHFNDLISDEEYVQQYENIINCSVSLIEAEAKLEAEKAKTAVAEAEKEKTELEKEKLKEVPATTEKEPEAENGNKDK